MKEKLYDLISIRLILYLFVFFLLTAPQLFLHVMANDFWKSLYTGRYLGYFHRFPHHSTFTFSEVVSFLPKNAFNWFGHLTIYHSYILTGFSGVQILRASAGLFAIFLALSLFRYRLHPIILLLLVLMIWGCHQKLLIRTALFGVIGTSALMWILLNYRKTNNEKLLYLLPPLFVIWSNFHGSYIFGLGILITYLSGEFLDWKFNVASVERFRLKTYMVIIPVIIFSVIFVKPFPDYKIFTFGKHILKSPISLTQSFTSSSYKKKIINDENHKPPSGNWFYNKTRKILQDLVFPERTFRSGEYRFPLDHLYYWSTKFSLSIAIILTILLLFDIRRFSFTYFGIYLLTLIVGLGYLRTIPYISLIYIPLLATLIDERNLSFIYKDIFIRISAYLLIVILVSYVGYYLFTNNLSHMMGGYSTPAIKLGKDELRFSKQMPDYLLKKFPEERVINDYNVGSYLVWRWWPYKKVFVDTKSKAYPQDFWEFFTTVKANIHKANKKKANLILKHTINLPDGRVYVELKEFDKTWKLHKKDKTLVIFKRKNNNED